MPRRKRSVVFMMSLAALVIPAGLLFFVVLAKAQSRAPEMRPTDSKETVSRGKAVFQGHCAICHFAASPVKKIGPGLKGLSTRTKFADGTKNHSQNLTRLIQNGGKNMPPLRGDLSDAQIRDLLAYLRTLS